MLLQDLWNIRIAILVFAIYFIIGRKFLYSLCPMVIMTGFPCPGCGLTRAMFMVLRGDFAGAWENASVYLWCDYYWWDGLACGDTYREKKRRVLGNG